MPLLMPKSGYAIAEYIKVQTWLFYSIYDLSSPFEDAIPSQSSLADHLVQGVITASLSSQGALVSSDVFSLLTTLSDLSGLIRVLVYFCLGAITHLFIDNHKACPHQLEIAK